MRKRSKYQLGWIIGGGLLFVLVLGPEGRKAGAWKIKVLTRSGFYYPVSESFLDAAGRPFPALEKQLEGGILPIHNQVWIDQGDIAHDVSRVVPFQYLSPIIRLYPKASYFRMTWHTSVPNSWVDYELIYNRDKGEVTETRTDHPSPGVLNSVLLGKYLTDRDIHEAGLDASKNWTDFEVWATQHWDR